jgi:dipeptidyl aminopeptidase/acylaminoacyl peptidase
MKNFITIKRSNLIIPGYVYVVLINLIICFSFIPLTAQQKALTFVDVMKFKRIKDPVISSDAKWIGFSSVIDRGNGEATIKSTEDETEYIFSRGSKPVFSRNSKWTAVTVLPDFLESENEKEKLENDLILLNNLSGDTSYYNRVSNFKFSEDSKWIAAHFYEEDKNDSTKEKNEKKKDKKPGGTDLLLKNLDGNNEIFIKNVISFQFDSTGNYFIYFVGDTSGASNALYARELKKENFPEIIIDKSLNAKYSSFEWNSREFLAFLKSFFDDKGKTDSSEIYLWQKSLNKIADSFSAPDNWMLPSVNNLKWSQDGKRLFFGFKPAASKKDEEADSTKNELYNFKKILSKKDLNVWHSNDPLIKTHAAKKWKDVKDQTYIAVYDLNENRIIKLNDADLPYLYHTENSNYALARRDELYLKEITWDDSFNDFYLIDLKTGDRKKIIEKISGTASLSPGGKYVIFYDKKNWHLHQIEKNITINLTENIKTPFYNEDHDQPAPPAGYGFAGWTEDEKEILIYDKYDIWKFKTSNGEYENLTNNFGRNNQLTFRVVKMDKKAEYLNTSNPLLLSGYNDKLKNSSYYSLDVKSKSLSKIIEESKKYKFVSKADEEERILFTKETYTEYPDLWITDLSFKTQKKLTDFGSQTKDFAWGEAELVEWESLEGIPLQGVLIKPGNYVQGKKYPVLVYYYELFSQRLYEFNEMVVNHRPNFPYYASNGYALFLPDIRFTVGEPGFSAIKCLVPGVQKLIEMGIADPDAVGLHGHSWSGYLTAFVITQSDIFACAIAGAPVTNMTSAYSGIRWGTGLARQFQYEKWQSRIGGSLWEAREKYIENSPVFFADNINTPLLIQHGDEDEAVPWYQSIEMYLAMRRLGKESIFLHYKGEPHHLKKYPNKLDYSIKMKEYLDHYLKNEPAEEWIRSGIHYSE